jgi:hypothetical protein
LTALAGTHDARGYRQWQQSDRHVKKGAKAFTIFAPCTKKIKEAGAEDRVICFGFRAHSPSLSHRLWQDYLEDCGNRDPEMTDYSESTRDRLRSTVFQVLSQAGYIENTRNLRLQTVQVDPQVLAYLRKHDEEYVLRCIQVCP